MPILIDGKKTAQEIRAQLKMRVDKLKQTGITPAPTRSTDPTCLR